AVQLEVVAVVSGCLAPPAVAGALQVPGTAALGAERVLARADGEGQGRREKDRPDGPGSDVSHSAPPVLPRAPHRARSCRYNAPGTLRVTMRPASPIVARGPLPVRGGHALPEGRVLRGPPHLRGTPRHDRLVQHEGVHLGAAALARLGQRDAARGAAGLAAAAAGAAARPATGAARGRGRAPRPARRAAHPAPAAGAAPRPGRAAAAEAAPEGPVGCRIRGRLPQGPSLGLRVTEAH